MGGGGGGCCCAAGDVVREQGWILANHRRHPGRFTRGGGAWRLGVGVVGGKHPDAHQVNGGRRPRTVADAVRKDADAASKIQG